MDELDKVISDNMGLVYKQLHRFNLQYDDDALSLGMEALMNAAKTYSYKKKAAFSTYATACIYNAVAGLLRKRQKASKVSIVSYNAIVAGDEHEDITYEGLFGVDRSPEDLYIDTFSQSLTMRLFWETYESLGSDAAKKTIKVWLDSDFTLNQSEIANRVGASQGYVSRILAMFKYKLKQKLEEQQ